MKHFFLLIIISLCLIPFVYAQKMGGLGGELSPVGVKINYRSWLSRTTGFEIFTGITTELDDFRPNDPEAGFKYLRTFTYNRDKRTYMGVMGKWKWIDIDKSHMSTSLPIPGILIGKEWFDQKRKLKGFALEFGYQFGHKEYEVYSPEKHLLIGRYTFDELPLIFNLRYSFYSKK